MASDEMALPSGSLALTCLINHVAYA